MDVDCCGVWYNDLFKFRWIIVVSGYNKDEEGYKGGNKGYDIDKQILGDVLVIQGDVYRVDRYIYDDVQCWKMNK